MTDTLAPTGRARGTVLAAAPLTIMAAAIIAPSLPAMREDFAETPGSGLLVRLALTVTSLAIAISAPLSGIVADRVGRRPLLLTGLGLYAVSGTAGFFVGAAAPAPGPHRDHHRQCRAHGRGLAGDRDRGHRRPGRDGTARGRSRRRFRRPEPQPALAALISNRNNGKETR